LTGALPAVLAMFIQFFVPESQRWREQRSRGTTSSWAVRDLLGVVIGAGCACLIVYLWASDFSLEVRLVGTALSLIVILIGYTYPVIRYLQRAQERSAQSTLLPTVRRMLLAACLSGIPLLATWAMVQWAPPWADQLAGPEHPEAKSFTQICSAAGAVLGTIVAALAGNWLNRRLTYVILCLGSLGSALAFFWLNEHYGPVFLASMFLTGAFTASFYGWLPLYLPELFHTGVRATAQGFSYNFGRVLAAIGVLQTGNLMGLFEGDYRKACSIMSLVYIVGMALIWLAPETRGKPLPE